MKRKLLTMLLLVAGATVCAQQRLTKSTPDLTNTEVPCREQIQFEFFSKQVACDRTDFNLQFFFIPQGVTSITWEVYNNENERVAQGSLKQVNVNVAETISLPNLPKGTYTFKLISYPFGCSSHPQTFDISAEKLTMRLKFSSKELFLGCQGGKPVIEFLVEGGVPPYKYTYETLDRTLRPLCNKNHIKPDEKDYCWDDLKGKIFQPIEFPAKEDTWVISVKDARDCVVIRDTVEINTRTAPKIGKITPQRCNSKDGKVPVKVDISSFGEGRLYYTLDNGKKQELKDKQRSFTVYVDDAAPRTHKIRLIDDYCPDDRTFEVPEPLTIIEKYTEGIVKCEGKPDILAVVRVKGGNAPYYYTLEHQAKGSSNTVTLETEVEIKNQAISRYVNEEGTYYFKIHDTATNGCPKEEVKTEITLEKPTLTITGELITATQYSCKGDKTLSKAKISIAESIRNIKKYKVEIFNSSDSRTPVATNQYDYTLPDHDDGGSFYAKITDIETGCSTLTNKVIVKPAAQLKIETEVVRAVSCDNDTEEIVIKAQPVRKGEQTTLHYTVRGTNGYSNEKSTSENEWRLTLPVGEYVITVTDENTGCNDVIEHQVKGRNVFVLKASQAVKATCANGEGTVTLTLHNTNKGREVEGFSYRILDNNQEIETKEVIGNTVVLRLKGGTYVVEVTVKETETGCTYTETVVIPENPTRIEVKATARVSSDCNNHKGEVVVNVYGGNAPYTVILTDASGKEVARKEGVATNYVFTNLSPANYTIKVSDASGCNEYQGDTNVTVQPSFVMEAVTVATVKPITCERKEEVTVKVAVAPEYVKGTWLRYTIKKDGKEYQTKRLAATTLSLNGNDALPVGDYTIEVLNETTNCVVTTTYTVKSPETYNLELSDAVRATCATDKGTVTLTLHDTNKGREVEGFTYRILDNNQEIETKEVIGNTVVLRLKGGTYVVGVTVKETGCKLTKEVVIPENPTRIEVKATARVSSDCKNHKGEVEVNVSGGNAPYTVILTDASGKEVARKEGVNTNYVFADLAPAKYTIKVSDTSGCNEYQGDTNVTVQPSFVMEAVAIETVKPITCDRDEEVTVKVTVAPEYVKDTWLRYTIKKDGKEYKKIRVADTTLSLNGNDALPVGDYTIEVLNETTNCVVTTTYTVKNPETYSLELSDAVRATCATDKGTVTLTLHDSNKGRQVEGFSYRIFANNQEIEAKEVRGNTVVLRLKGGVYVVKIKENTTGCELSKEVVIPENPTRIEVKATARVSSDCKNHKGEVEVNVSGGNAPYTVILTDASGKEVARKEGVNTNYVFTDLAPANYTIKVSDASGCNEYQGDTNVTVQPSFVMEAVAIETVKPITCDRDEEVTVKVTVAPEYVKGTWLLYTIKKDGKEYKKIRLAATTLSLNSNDALPVGDYTIEVLNETTNCVVTTTYTVKSPETYNLELSDAVRATCANGEGTVTLTLHDTNKGRQVEGFTYRILDNNQEIETKEVRGNTVVLHLKGGVYRVELTVKGTGCKLTKEIVIPENPTPIEVKATARVSSDCSNHRGEVEVNVSRGSAPYTVILTDASGKEVAKKEEVTADYVFADLAPAKYTIKVSDASGCNEYQGDTNVTVQPSFVMEAVTVATVKPITCERNEEVVVKVTVAPEYVKGTWLHYTIKKDGKEYKQIRVAATTLSLNGNDALPVGDYTIEVLNETTKCVVTTTYTVKNPETYSLELSDAVRATCATDKGTVTLTLHDTNKGRQVEGFRYRVFKDAVMQEMNEVRGNSVVLRLKGGVYRVELTVKETGCKLTKEVVIPENPVPVQVKAISQIATDCNYERAVAQVEVNGGTAPYNLVLTHKATGKVYSESVQTNTINFNNLEAGTYYVRATDSAGCSAETSVLITVGKNMIATGLQLTTTPPTCTGEKDATLSFSAITTGGVAPYTYKLEKLNTEKHPIIPITNFNSSGTLVEGLSSGIYRLYVEDSKGCQLTLTTTAIYDPYPISAQINLTKSVFRSCNGEKTGSVVITNIEGGTGQYKVYIVSYDRKKVIDRKDNVKAGDTVTFEGLAPLENVYYEVVIQDSNKCLFLNFTPFLVKDESRIGIESVKGEYVCDPASEKGYTILLTVKFKNAEVDFTDLVYSIDNNHVMPFTRTEGNIAYIDNFTAITDVHTIEVSHKGGITNSVCPNTIANFSLSPLSPFTLERVPNDELNTIEVIAKGGKTNDLQGYTYYFNGENNGSNPVYKVRNNTPERLEDGVRIKMVEVIAVDAEGCRRKLMVEIPYIDVDIPNNFTPNGDGTNDRWKPNNLKDYPNALVHIYDRYGRRMATLKPGETWDGVYEGRHMPSGDYWYVIDLNDALIDGRKIYGHFSLYR